MNEHKFDKKGEIYSKARPSYPDKLFIYLKDQNLISDSTVAADIGSGTGIFTEKLCPYVSRVFAVEPNDGMRSVAEDKYTAYENIISVNGSAEDTKLSDKSVDFITVAQAFHWFDRQSFKTECRRILKDDGNILLVWNDRDTESELIRENYDINRRFCPNFKGSSNGFDFSRDTFRDFFDDDFDTVQFRNDLIYDENTFVLRCLSSSYAPKPGEENYDEYVAELQKLFKKHSLNGTASYPYITRCYIGRLSKRSV